MRTASLAAVLSAAAMVTPAATPSASAAGAVVLTCTVSGHVGTCAATGTMTGGQSRPATITIDSLLVAVATCGERATGTITGAVSTTFSWTRQGVAGVVTTSGGSIGTGSGSAAFTTPCRSTAETVVLTLAGT